MLLCPWSDYVGMFETETYHPANFDNRLDQTNGVSIHDCFCLAFSMLEAIVVSFNVLETTCLTYCSRRKIQQPYLE